MNLSDENEISMDLTDDLYESEDEGTTPIVNPAFSTTVAPGFASLRPQEEEDEEDPLGIDDQWESVTKADLNALAKKNREDAELSALANFASQTFERNTGVVKQNIDNAFAKFGAKLTDKWDADIQQALSQAHPIRLHQIATDPNEMKDFIARLVLDAETEPIKRSGGFSGAGAVDAPSVATTPRSAGNSTAGLPPLSSIDPSAMDSIKSFARAAANAEGISEKEAQAKIIRSLHEKGQLRLRNPR
jgi:hypothetical protein